nr:aldehyde dehydrogenase family protein [Ardenticatenales bacterium]
MAKVLPEEPTVIDLSVQERNPAMEPDPHLHLGPRLSSYNPATGALLGHVPLLGREGIDAAVRAAHEAQQIWARRSPRERAIALHQFNEALVADADATARLISMEQGKPVVEAMSIEMLSVLPQVKWLAEEGAKLLEGRAAPIHHPLFTAKQGCYEYEPMGVIAVISPWNYPFAIPTIQVMTAL